MDVRGIPSVIIALAEDPAMLRQILSRRVHFTMQKPVADLMVRTLKAAYSMIVAEKRISFRHSVRSKAEVRILDRNSRRPLGATIIRVVRPTGHGLRKQDIVTR